MDYTQLNPLQRQEMLQAIGINHVDVLFEAIPDAIRCKDGLDLMPALSELELQRNQNFLAICFL